MNLKLQTDGLIASKAETGLRLNSFLEKQEMSVKKQSIPGRKDFQNSYKDMRQRTYGTWMRLGSFLELYQTSLCHKRLVIAQEERDQRRDWLVLSSWMWVGTKRSPSLLGSQPILDALGESRIKRDTSMRVLQSTQSLDGKWHPYWNSKKTECSIKKRKTYNSSPHG